ncbi:hypothetical protein D1159_16125 [Pseudoflavonifractor sp. 524-17]|uniref:hypothetical protein n=1 Tax=Pseudoflavonifractor sp. 524-17 TaxID=2304577 RepID=UPI0013798B32|nr:hypothetical protein [Pseudoflavonifractor sp. 524-17]NCE66064.1 hypothetical protein [Pseudoflavonifractor sp. 524-17]
MSTEKSMEMMDKGAENAADEAFGQEEAAKAGQDSTVYVHTFKRPMVYQGATIETLAFDWGALTGADHLAIENELLMRGKTLVTPEFTGEFLCGMAIRACTERSPEGFRVLNIDAMRAMPMRDFQTICKKARAFLLRAGS